MLRYANLNHYDITITKESMYPEFTLNGIEYTAHREHHRYCATVHCEAKHPEELEPAEIPSGRKKLLKLIRWILPHLLIFGFFFLFNNITAGIIACVIVLILEINWGKVYDRLS